MNDNVGHFVVLAEFRLEKDSLPKFLTLAHEDARQSLANEPGCHQFDVLITEADPLTVVLHEVYSDRQAFDAHTQMPHYAPFKEGSAPLLAAAPVIRFFTVAAEEQHSPS